MQISANGINLEVEDHGSPTGEPLLLIMGLGMQLVAWQPGFVASLVARGYRVIRFDNRDVGRSGRVRWHQTLHLPRALIKGSLGLRVDAPYRIDDMADDAAGLLAALQVERAHIVGASLGGMIAQMLAVRHPARVRSLTSIMSGTGNRLRSLPSWRALKALLSRPDDPRDVDNVVEHLVRLFGVIGSPGYPVAAGLLRRQFRRSVERSYDPAGTARQLLAVVASGDRRKALRRIVAPTLVIHGAADVLVPLAAGRDTATNIAGARLEIIEGMGHDLPQALLPRLVDLIATHCAAADAQGARGQDRGLG